MSSQGVPVMMYHRVCRRTDDAACYFVRGTAVEPEVFAAQIAWIARRRRFVGLGEAVRRLRAATPDCGRLCVLTMDDGYRDALVASETGVPLTLFPIAGHLGSSRYAAYVDRYYDLLHRCRRATSIAAREIGIGLAGDAPAPDRDLAWWVRGPVKARLHALGSDAQEALLDRLAVVLDATPSPGLARRLYLSMEDLRALRRAGHEIGGHGLHHRRLDGLDSVSMHDEIAGAKAMLDALGVSAPRVFAWPDGAYGAAAERGIADAGFRFACTVESGMATRTTRPLRLPRLSMPNVFPGAPGFPGAELE